MLSRRNFLAKTGASAGAVTAVISSSTNRLAAAPDRAESSGDGTWLTYYDAELRQRKDVPLGSTIADFITRSNVRLSGDVTVVKVSRGNNLLSVQLVQTDKPEEGSLTLNLSTNPMLLQSWVAVDAQGTVTQVDLTGMQPGVQLDNKLFIVPRKKSDR